MPCDRDTEGVVLLPNLVAAKFYAELPDGKKTYVTSAGTLVCEHGECAATIAWWVMQERRAAAAGLPPPPRGGARAKAVCDCTATTGLHYNVSPECVPCTPGSLYEVLEQQGAEKVFARGKIARRVPHSDGLFLTQAGVLVCRHGLSRRLLARQGGRARCDCRVGALPVRAARALPLGVQKKL